jgi:ketosteroid isomerase-like protein
VGELQNLVERFYEAFNRGDFDAAMECFDPNVKTVEPSTEEMHGADAWRAFGETFKRAMPDAKLELKTAIESGDKLVVEGEFTGTFTAPFATPQGEAEPTGNSIRVPFADIFYVSGGVVVEHHTYYDQMTMLGQLGLLPEGAPASGG